jgi:phosphoglycolate phosphatase-like HAD superfamily hydrolase
MSFSIPRNPRPASTAQAPWPEDALHIVFDLEGLLLDLRPAVAAAMKAALEAVTQPAHRRPVAVPQNASVRAILAARLGSEEPALLAKAHEAYRQHYHAHASAHAVVRPDAAELLDWMRQSTACRWHYLSTRGVDAACRLIEKHGLANHLCGLHTPWRPVMPGARPQLLAHLLQGDMAGLRHCAVLSDCPYELWMSAELGRTTVALGYGQHDPDALSASQPTAWARDCGDVAEWLRRWSSSVRGNVVPMRASVGVH